MKGYVFNVLVGLDQFANTLLGGKPEDTISYNAALARKDGKRWGCVLCRLLDWLQKDHCEKTVESTKADWVARAAEVQQGKDPL